MRILLLLLISASAAAQCTTEIDPFTRDTVRTAAVVDYGTMFVLAKRTNAVTTVTFALDRVVCFEPGARGIILFEGSTRKEIRNLVTSCRGNFTIAADTSLLRPIGAIRFYGDDGFIDSPPLDSLFTNTIKCLLK